MHLDSWVLYENAYPELPSPGSTLESSGDFKYTKVQAYWIDPLWLWKELEHHHFLVAWNGPNM